MVGGREEIELPKCHAQAGGINMILSALSVFRLHDMREHSTHVLGENSHWKLWLLSTLISSLMLSDFHEN